MSSAYLLLFLLFFSVSGEEKFDPKNPGKSTESYCKIKCPTADGGYVTSTACKCTPVPPRKEITENPSVVELRQTMLDLHNKWRNYQAMGLENRTAFTPASSNMHVLNYDLECEYVARCHAINLFRRYKEDKSGHDLCRTDSRGNFMGQNLGGSEYGSTEAHLNSVNRWYNEVVHTNPTTVDKYVGNPDKKKQIGHWAQVVYAESQYVGCVRGINPKNPPVWSNFIICNYRSEPPLKGGVHQHMPVYKRGEPCSQCPDGTKCETEQYPGLCGKLYPATQEPPPMPDLTGRVAGCVANKFVLILVLLIVILA